MGMGDDSSSGGNEDGRNTGIGVHKQLLSMAIVAAGHSGYTGEGNAT